jgi:putative oxidoreductase
MSDAAGAVLLAGRIVVSLFFFFSASFHLFQGAQAEGYAKSVGFPWPKLAGWPSGLYLLAAATSVSVGIWPDLGALLIGLWVIPTALWFHAFWKLEDQMQRMSQMQLFWRNVTFLGMAIALLAVFAGLGDAVRFTVTGPLFSF